jgi:hypothetical protein
MSWRKKFKITEKHEKEWTEAKEEIGKLSSLVKGEALDDGDGAPIEWKKAIKKSLEGRDTDGMIENIMPEVQLGIAKIAFEGGAKGDSTKLKALQFLAGQAGYGAIDRKEIRTQFDDVSDRSQMYAMIGSMMKELYAKDPNAMKLIEGVKSLSTIKGKEMAVMEAEVVNGEDDD